MITPRLSSSDSLALCAATATSTTSSHAACRAQGTTGVSSSCTAAMPSWLPPEVRPARCRLRTCSCSKHTRYHTAMVLPESEGYGSTTTCPSFKLSGTCGQWLVGVAAQVRRDLPPRCSSLLHMQTSSPKRTHLRHGARRQPLDRLHAAVAVAQAEAQHVSQQGRPPLPRGPAQVHPLVVQRDLAQHRLGGPPDTLAAAADGAGQGRSGWRRQRAGLALPRCCLQVKAPPPPTSCVRCT